RTTERVRHAEGDQLILERPLPAHLEPRKENFDDAIAPPRYTFLKHPSRKLLLEIAKTVSSIWQEHDHGQATAAIAELDRLVSVQLCVRNPRLLVHEVR